MKNTYQNLQRNPTEYRKKQKTNKQKNIQSPRGSLSLGKQTKQCNISEVVLHFQYDMA